MEPTKIFNHFDIFSVHIIRLGDQLVYNTYNLVITLIFEIHCLLSKIRSYFCQLIIKGTQVKSKNIFTGAIFLGKNLHLVG